MASSKFRAILGLVLLATLVSCAGRIRQPAPSFRHPIITTGYFSLRPSMRLPYRVWRPKGRPQAMVLALHGFNDSRDAFAMPGPAFAAAGILLVAPDQQGFGAAPGRGHWPGTAVLLADARKMLAELHDQHPRIPLVLMGESMGAAEALLLAAQGDADVASYILVSPAVWGGTAMAPPLRIATALAGTLAPNVRLTGRQAHIRASDNTAALIALSEDPLTIVVTRLGAVAGLVRLMGRAQAACHDFAPPHALVLYGGHDELIPKSAMARCWRAMPADPGVVLAYYPEDYHLMLLDHQRAIPTRDIIDFILHPNHPLPSEAAVNALIFSAEHS